MKTRNHLSRNFVGAIATFALVLLPTLGGTASAANFGAHAGLAEDTVPDPYFVAGALLADLDHFLPPGEPQTDSEAFAWGVVARSWTGSHRAWALSRGWLEHIDQDARFVDSVVAIQGVYPAYTVTDVRLAFDYWTLTKHPFSTAFEFLLADPEAHGIIAGGLVATDAAGVRTAIYDLLYSTDVNAPGLFMQIDAARLYGLLYPQVVRDLESFYDAYYAAAVAGHEDPFPPIDRMLIRIHQVIRRLPPGQRAGLEPLVVDARGLARDRPPGWFADMEGDLREIAAMSPRSTIVADIVWQVLDAIDPP